MTKRNVLLVALFLLMSLCVSPKVLAQQIQVPNVVNMDATQASQLLLKSGLRPNISGHSITSDQRSSGRIAAQSPTAGQKVLKNSIVNLTSYQYQPPPPTITLSSPKQGDKWASGSTQVVKWMYNGTPPSPNIYMMLYRGGAAYIFEGNFAFMQQAVPVGNGGNGSYSWAIPPKLPDGNDYQLCVGLKTGAPVSACSDKFTIAATAAPSLTLLSPVGGESYKVGTVQTVKWNYKGDPGKTIYVIMNNSGKVLYSLGTVPVGNGGSGSFNWTVPPRSMGTENSIKIVSTTNDRIFDGSKRVFRVWMPTPTLNVLSPAKGEKWKLGDTMTIKWAYSGGNTLPDEAPWYNWKYIVNLCKNGQPLFRMSGDTLGAWKDTSTSMQFRFERGWFPGSNFKPGDDYTIEVIGPGYMNESGHWTNVKGYRGKFTLLEK